MKTKLYFSVFVIFLFQINLFGQFFSVTIQTVDSKILEGFVLEDDFSQYTKGISFLKTKESNGEFYSPVKIKSVLIDNVIFKPIYLEEKKSHFLSEINVEGDVEFIILYQDKEVEYFVRKDGELTLLEQIVIDKEKKRSVSKKYKKTLRKVLNQEIISDNRIDAVVYSKRSFRAIISEHNHSNGSAQYEMKNTSKMTLGLSLQARYLFSGRNLTLFSENKVNYRIFTDVMISNPQVLKAFSAHVGLMYGNRTYREPSRTVRDVSREPIFNSVGEITGLRDIVTVRDTKERDFSTTTFGIPLYVRVNNPYRKVSFF